MKAVFKSLVVSLAAAGLCTTGLPARATECVIDAYEAYAYATGTAKRPFDRKLLFSCEVDGYGSDMVKPKLDIDASGGIRCSGAADTTDTGAVRVRMELFATPGASIATNRGWALVDYDVDGGAFTKLERRDSLILFGFDVQRNGTDFERRLKSITFSRPEGDCSRVLEEALNWPE